MSTKAIFLMLACSCMAAISTALFRHVLKGRYMWKGDVLLLIRDTLAMLMHPMFLLALAVFAGANVLWLVVLGSQKLSVAYPVQVSLVVLFNAIISAFFFSEHLTPQGYMGLVLVVVGVTLIVR